MDPSDLDPSDLSPPLSRRRQQASTPRTRNVRDRTSSTSLSRLVHQTRQNEAADAGSAQLLRAVRIPAGGTRKPADTKLPRGVEARPDCTCRLASLGERCSGSRRQAAATARAAASGDFSDSDRPDRFDGGRRSRIGRDEHLSGVSVLQAGELPSDETPAEVSERRAVFDGVVRYGEDLVLVVESKLDGRFDERQARNITIGETAWRVDPVRARLRWREIIAAWRDLLLRDLVSGSERKVLEDFMWLVQRHFPRLQPFADLGVCRGNEYLLRLRCKAILDELGSVPTELRPTGAILLLQDAHTVKLAALEPDADEDAVRLRLWPGDTLEQAKALYADAKRVDRLLSLRDRGWRVAPNFHFGHMAKGFVWTTGDIGVEDYVEHWAKQIGSAGQIRREDWRGYFDQLIELRIASRADRENFDRDFTDTKRNSATPRPGLRVECSWPLDSAAQLDRSHKFGRQVHDSTNTVLSALGETSI
jgi:hypothetical protein